MADKRISQLVDRGTVVNNDVIPIVVSGAVTTNKATISSIQTFMQGNLDVGVTSVGITLGSTGTDVNVSGSPVTSSGNITINFPTASATNRGLLSSANWTTFNNKVSSVGLSMPSAFAVANSPITGSGTIAVTGAGTVAQYIRGDGSLADFPSGGGGGGASVNYYLNGSVSQGSIGGIGYSQMSKTPILGAGTDFTIASTNYIASFITDAGNPALLEIPAGNWNFESYFSASSGGGSPSFYIELYKVNSGGTATLIASSSATPELISFGTSISPYFSPLAVPATVLTITDRLAVRYFVNNSGRTITLHTENSHLCQIITTFTTGLTALNGLTAQVQNFATGTSGTDFAISSTSATHTFNLPDASASARGVVTTGTQTFAGYKIFNGTIGVNNDIQLATNGTALNTFIKNINAVGLTSIGSNGFGFNNSNNIYFSGSSKGGGIFAFSNTGNQTYTLQDASGTLAFTSDLSAYLPLAGGTLTGAIVGTTSTFTNSGAGIGVGVTNSGSGDGVKITHSAGRAFNIQSSGAGFGVIINNETASTSAPFTIQKQGTNKVAFTDAGAADFSSSVTASSFVKSSGTSAQFLKADGSVDSSTYLTTGSAASTYLPLAGGTLTGALNGTSATFSGSVTPTGITNNSIYYGKANASFPATSLGYFALKTNNLDGERGGLTVQVSNATSTFIDALTINYTGAATFSSSVQAKSGKFFSANGTTYASAAQLRVDGGGVNNNYAQIEFSDSALSDGKISYYPANLAADRFFSISARLTESDFVIRGSGNVGIGTASPTGKLNVKGDIIIERTSNTENSTITMEGGEFDIKASPFNYATRFFTGTGGTSTERMRITSAGNTQPGADNAYSLGVSGTRWSAVWAANGTIQTSDEREKKDIIDSDLGLDFVNQLRPVSFKWKVGQNLVTSEVVKDEEGNPILDEEGNEKTEPVIIPREGKRTHYGLIAQEVQELLDGKDFGGFIHDEETDTKGLRYDQFVPLLIKSIQELSQKIVILESKLK